VEQELSVRRPYSVAVALAGDDASTFLRIVATLHRRGVPVVEAALSRPTADRRAFAATFVATGRQARVVAASLRRLVDVVGVELSEAADGPSTWTCRQPRPR
jgi:acetolactate synthase regulatory subunit